jgi:hypothetical protein
MTCLSSCNRQENPISTSTYKFPNKMFLASRDLFLLLKKLTMSCQTKATRFGPKRRLLDIDHPGLCPFYDQYVYNDQNVRLFLASDMPKSYTMNDIFRLINMSSEDLVTFKQELMTYATKNMVKITAYIESPYVKTYQTNEVMNVLLSSIITIILQVMTVITLIANVGGMLGLCFGLSFVSVAEILATIVQLLWKSANHKNK